MSAISAQAIEPQISAAHQLCPSRQINEIPRATKTSFNKAPSPLPQSAHQLAISYDSKVIDAR